MTTLPPTAPYPSSGIPPSVPPTHLTSLGHLICSGNMTSYRRGVQLHGGGTFTGMLSHITSPLIGSVYTGVSIVCSYFFLPYSQVGRLSPLSLPPIAKAIQFIRMLCLGTPRSKVDLKSAHCIMPVHPIDCHMYYLDDHLLLLPLSSVSSTSLLSQGWGIFDFLGVPVADD